MREAAMFTSLARTTGSVDQAAIQRSTPVRPHETTRSQPPTPLDLTLVPPKRHSENVDGALDLSVKKTKAASEDDVSDDVIIVCMQQAPARYGTGPGRVASYYGSELATKGRPQECGQVFSSGTRARSLNALCTSSPHKRRSSSQVEFLRRWSREPGVNICAQAPPRLAESEAGHAYERSSESQPHRQAARESTTRPGCEYLGRDVLPFVPTSSQQLLQQQLLQQQHHMQLLKQQHQQQQKLQRHPDMLNRSRCSPAVCLSPAVSLSPALPTNRLSPQLFVGVDVNSRVPNKSAQVNATRRPHIGSSTYGLLYEKTLPPHSFHTAHDLHNGPYSMIPPTMGDNTRCLYANEKEHARPSSHCVPKPHRDRSTSSERPLSTAEVEQHIRKSLDHAVSLVQTPRVPLRQNRVSSDSSLFPVRPEVDTLRCGTSSSALYHAMLNGSEPIGQPKVATPTGSVPLAKPRDGATKKPPESVVFRSPERVPRSRGDGMAPSKRTVPPPLLYSPHLCLSDSHPAVSGRRSAEHMRMAIGADHFDHRGLVSSGGVLRGSDTSAGDRARCGQALPHSIPEATHGVDVTSPGTSTQGRELEQLRHAPYLLSMLTSQKAELSSSSEQYDHMIGIVRRRDATPAGGICVAGPQDRYVGPYAVPAQHADNRSRGKHQLASCKRSDPRPTNTSNNVVPHPETTSSLTSGKTTHYHRRGSGVDTHVPTDGDAHGRGSAQHTLPSGIRYYKCPTSTKPFTKLPTGDLVSVDKFPSKPIPVANVNPIVKSAYKSGVRAAEYDEKMAGSGSATGDFSRVSASTFTSGVLATTGSGDTTTNSCADGVDANNDVAKKAVTAKTEYSHKDAPNKCAVGVSVHKSVHQSRPSKEPPPTKEAYLCSRRDLALYLSTPKGRQKLKLRDNMSNAGDSCKPTTKSEDYLVADDQTILGVDAPQCGDVKPLGGETLSDFCLSTNEKLSAKTNAYSDLNNTHQPLRDCATIDSDRKPDTKSTFATASPNGDNSAVCTKSDVNKRFATDASLPRGQQPDKFITRKSRILESIRKKSGQQVARQSRQRPEKSVKRGKQTEATRTKERSLLSKERSLPSKVVTAERKRKLRRSRRLTGRDATAIDLPLVARTKSAPRRSRRVTSYNKNAAYEEELQKDEERRLLLRAKRNAHRYQTNDVIPTRVIPKQLCRLRSARQNRVLANRKRKQLSSSTADPEFDGDGGTLSPERPTTAEDEDGKEASIDVKPEISDVSTSGGGTSAQKGDGVAKVKRKKGVVCGDRRGLNGLSGDVTTGHDVAGELVTRPPGHVVPIVIKGIVNGIRRYRKRKTKAYYMLSHEHRRRHRLLAKNRGSTVGGRRSQQSYRRPSLALRLALARTSVLSDPLRQVKTEPVAVNVPYDPYGEETETEEADEETRADVACATDAKRLVVCKKTGETTLHKAARLGYESVVAACIESQVALVNVRDNAGYTPLHESCVTGGLAIVKRLLAADADVNAASQDGTRPIHDAVDNDHLEIVRLLLSCGADPTISTYSGRTPLRLSRSADMEAFLKGYFCDLNGLVTTDPGSWQFLYSTGVVNDSVVESGCDIFNDVPSDPEAEDDVVELTFCADLELFAYHLCLSPAKGARNYYSASDVAGRLSVSEESLEVRYGDRLTLAVAGRAQLKEQLYPSCILQVPHIKALLAESQVNVFSFVEVDDAARLLLGDVTLTVPLFDVPVDATPRGDTTKLESNRVHGNVNARDSTSPAGDGLAGNLIRRTPTNENAVKCRCAWKEEGVCEHRNESGKQEGVGIKTEALPQTVGVCKPTGKLKMCAAASADNFDATRAVDKLSRRCNSPAELIPPVDSKAVHGIDGVQGISHESGAAPSTVHMDVRHSPDTAIHEPKRRSDASSSVEPGCTKCSNRQANDVEPGCTKCSNRQANDVEPGCTKCSSRQANDVEPGCTKCSSQQANDVEPGCTKCSSRQANDVEPTCAVRRAAYRSRLNSTAASCRNGVTTADENGRTSVRNLGRLVKLAEERAVPLAAAKRPICLAAPSGDKPHKTSACNSAQLSESAPTPSCCHSNVADDASTSDDPALPVLEKHEIECETEPATPNSQPVRTDSVYDDSEMPELICCAY